MRTGTGDAESDNEVNSPIQTGSAYSGYEDIAQEFADDEFASGQNQNAAVKNFKPYAFALFLWLIILSLRFIWWNKPKRFYYLNRDSF